MKRILNSIKGLKGKVQLVFAGFFFVSLSLFGVVMYFTIKPDLTDKAVQELSSITRVSSSLLSEYTNTLIEDHLVSMAKNIKNVAEYQYKLFKLDEITENEAYDSFSRFILDPELGKVGDTGYLAGVNSKGILEIHPKSPGADASGFDFMKKATSLKNGFIEYEWANVGEEVPRVKAGGMAYFEPWDLIIWVSSYKSEFTSLINVERIADSLGCIQIGENGYVWVMDSSGRIIYHPGMNQRDISSVVDEDGNLFIQEMLTAVSDGPSIYHSAVIPSVSDMPTGEPSKELIVFTDIPDLGWIIVSQIPVEETTVLLRKILLSMIILAVVSILVMNILVHQNPPSC